MQIQRIQMFGERHSSTKYLASQLRRYFKIPVVTTFGHKHFFTIEKILKQQHLLDTTFFIAIVRNPYSWLSGMYNLPYHCNIFNKKDKNIFLTSEWESKNDAGKIIHEDNHIFNKQKYKNIFELRSTKNIFLKYSMPKLVPYYKFIKYEYFLQSNYLQFLIHNIANQYNLSLKDSLRESRRLEVFTKGSRPIDTFYSKEILSLVNQNMDWCIENDIGYYPIYNIQQSNTDISQINKADYLLHRFSAPSGKRK